MWPKVLGVVCVWSGYHLKYPYLKRLSRLTPEPYVVPAGTTIVTSTSTSVLDDTTSGPFELSCSNAIRHRRRL